MKNLLYKELKLSVPVQTWIFVFLSILIFIPSWPSLVSFFYPLAGFSVVFSLGAANRDVLYTSTLPVRKRDIPRGKTALLCFLELLTVLVSIPFAFIKLFLLSGVEDVAEYPELGVNFATYGFVFLIFGIFNLIVLPWFYQKADGKSTMPFVIGTLLTMIVMGAIMAIFMTIPGASTFINTFSGINLLTQLGILLFGLMVFVLFSLLASRLSEKNFQKVDI